MKHIFFFATSADIKPVLRRFERCGNFKYVKTGMRTEANRQIYIHSSEIPDCGVASHETGSLSNSYLVSEKGLENVVYAFVAKDGKRRWLLSNGDNPDSVILTMAGLWKTGTLLPGNMSTLHQTNCAQQLMRWFLAALKSESFTKVDLYWLGPEALEMLRSGKRLTKTAEQSPPEFDLRLS